MNRRWITLELFGKVVLVWLHVADSQGEFSFWCGHHHRFDRTARRCASDRWPGVEIRA